MPESFNQYAHFTATDFALDDEFIKWVLVSEENSNVFWDKVISAHPDQKENIEAAKKIILSFNNTLDKSSDEIRDRIWENVMRESHGHNTRVVKFNYRRLWAAAAIALFVAFGSWYLVIKNKEPQKTVVRNTPVNDIPPGGNKAILTLADGSTIILDSANNGAITRQGNMTVVKLNNGEIAYNPEPGNPARAEQAPKPGTLTYNTITTPRGGQYQLTLSDGTKVWLNAESSLRYPTAFTGTERKVELTGEGYFEVAHNASKPFYVTTEDMNVKVLGTHFNVNAYGDDGELKTTLLEGKVEVTSLRNSVVLKPGEQARLGEATHELKTSNKVNIEEVIAWKEGLFYFDNTNLKELMKTLSRWYGMDVVFESNLQEKRFTGKMYRDVNISEVFQVLEGLKVHFRIDGNKIIVNNK